MIVKRFYHPRIEDKLNGVFIRKKVNALVSHRTVLYKCRSLITSSLEKSNTVQMWLGHGQKDGRNLS